MGLQPVLAALVTVAGVGLTSIGIFSHTATVVAPGALLSLVGGGWLGNSLARSRVKDTP